jgi:hypothetical protein
LASTFIGTCVENSVTEDFKISFPALGHTGQCDAACSTNVAASMPGRIANSFVGNVKLKDVTQNGAGRHVVSVVK